MATKTMKIQTQLTQTQMYSGLDNTNTAHIQSQVRMQANNQQTNQFIDLLRQAGRELYQAKAGDVVKIRWTDGNLWLASLIRKISDTRYMYRFHGEKQSRKCHISQIEGFSDKYFPDDVLERTGIKVTELEHIGLPQEVPVNRPFGAYKINIPEEYKKTYTNIQTWPSLLSTVTGINKSTQTFEQTQPNLKDGMIVRGMSMTEDEKDTAEGVCRNTNTKFRGLSSNWFKVTEILVSDKEVQDEKENCNNWITLQNPLWMFDGFQFTSFKGDMNGQKFLGYKSIQEHQLSDLGPKLRNQILNQFEYVDTNDKIDEEIEKLIEQDIQSLVRTGVWNRYLQAEGFVGNHALAHNPQRVIGKDGKIEKECKWVIMRRLRYRVLKQNKLEFQHYDTILETIESDDEKESSIIGQEHQAAKVEGLKFFLQNPAVNPEIHYVKKYSQYLTNTFPYRQGNLTVSREQSEKADGFKNFLINAVSKMYGKQKAEQHVKDTLECESGVKSDVLGPLLALNFYKGGDMVAPTISYSAQFSRSRKQFLNLLELRSNQIQTQAVCEKKWDTTPETNVNWMEQNFTQGISSQKAQALACNRWIVGRVVDGLLGQGGFEQQNLRSSYKEVEEIIIASLIQDYFVKNGEDYWNDMQQRKAERKRWQAVQKSEQYRQGSKLKQRQYQNGHKQQLENITNNEDQMKMFHRVLKYDQLRIFEEKIHSRQFKTVLQQPEAGNYDKKIFFRN